jgi:hypothetical protein
MNSPAKKQPVCKLFDAKFYSKQCDIPFDSYTHAWKHYCENGAESECEPAPYFMSKWYRWQNPDCQAFSSVLEHFETAGKHRIIDPSPYVDLIQVSRGSGAENSISAYQKLLECELTSRQGVYKDISELEENQVAFLKNIQIEKLFDRREQSEITKRNCLVWVQIGPSSKFREWFNKGHERTWDVLCNWYSFDAVDLSLGEIGFAQKGTKFTGLLKVLQNYKETFSQYEQVILIDDDLEFEFSDIDKLFQIARDNNLSMFQPSLTEDSYCIWPDIKSNKQTGVIPFNTVEIMMPGFSKDFLLSNQSLFEETVSGFGLDLALGRVAAQDELEVGVIYDVKAKHLKPINQSTGAFYDYLRSFGINSKLELWRLIEKYSLDTEIKALKK